LQAVQAPEDAEHCAQPSPPTEVAALHGVHSPAPANEYVEEGHWWQEKSPALEYVPAAQATGSEVLPCTQLKPAGHSLQEGDAGPL
jgi:hypothetical protein